MLTVSTARRLARPLTSAVVGALLAVTSTAQDLGFEIPGAERLRVVETTVEPATAAPGAAVTVLLECEVSPGWHVYGAKQDPELGIVPSASLSAGLVADGETVLPPGVAHGEGEFRTYWVDGKFTIELPARVPAGAEQGDLEFTGEVAYSACTETSCDPLASTDFSGSLTVAGDPVTDDDPVAEDPDNHIAVLSAAFDPATVGPGQITTLRITVQIEKGWHAYGSKQDPGTGIPLTFEALTTDELIATGEAQVPPGELHMLGSDPYHWLSGTFELSQTFRVADSVEPGDALAAPLELSYLICDDNSCLIPSSMVVPAAELTVGEAAAPATDPTVDVGTAATDQEAEEGDDGARLGNLWTVLVLAFGAGLFALAMPCTYPMIPVTFSFFLKQSETRGGSVLTLALIYGLGIITMFTLIGVTLGPLINSVADHWITNLAFGIAFVAFALVLFGAIDLQPPAFLMNVAGKASLQGGLLGVFLMGAVLVVTTFTCTAPFIGNVLVVASDEPLSAMIAMATFGLTMAVPFVVLAVVPSRLKAMPRSGEWMHVVKVTLGFVELAAALKFLSNAEIYLGLELLPRELFLWLWSGLFALAGLFLLNLIKIEGEHAERIGPGRLAAATGFVMFAIYFGHGAMGAKLDSIMTSIEPPYSATRVGATAAIGTPTEGEAGAHAAQWSLVVDDFEAARERAEREGKLVLFNYTGKVCPACRQVENDVFPSPDVATVLSEHYVEARVHRDTIEDGSLESKLQSEILRSVATPQYIIVDPATVERLEHHGKHALSGAPSSWHDKMLTFLEDGLAKAGRARPGR